MTTDDLIGAWERWDEQPGAEHTSRPLEAIVQTISAELGLSPSRLRADISSRRRSGATARDAIERAIRRSGEVK